VVSIVCAAGPAGDHDPPLAVPSQLRRDGTPRRSAGRGYMMAEAFRLEGISLLPPSFFFLLASRFYQCQHSIRRPAAQRHQSYKQVSLQGVNRHLRVPGTLFPPIHLVGCALERVLRGGHWLLGLRCGPLPTPLTNPLLMILTPRGMFPSPGAASSLSFTCIAK